MDSSTELEARLVDPPNNAPVLLRLCSAIAENTCRRNNLIPLSLGFFTTSTTVAGGMGSAILKEFWPNKYDPLPAMATNFATALVLSLPLLYLLGREMARHGFEQPTNNDQRINRVIFFNSAVSILLSPLSSGLYYLTKEWLSENEDLNMGPLEFVLASALGSTLIDVGIYTSKACVNRFVTHTEDCSFRQ
jgi:hypothetical protein